MLGNAQFVARVGDQGVAGVKLDGDLARELRCEAARHIDRGHLVELLFGPGREFGLFAREVRRLAVGLRADGDVLARRHGHRASHQARARRQQNRAARGLRRRHADHQGGGGDNTIIGTEHGRAQPSDPRHGVSFDVRL